MSNRDKRKCWLIPWFSKQCQCMSYTSSVGIHLYLCWLLTYNDLLNYGVRIIIYYHEHIQSSIAVFTIASNYTSSLTQFGKSSFRKITQSWVCYIVTCVLYYAIILMYMFMLRCEMLLSPIPSSLASVMQIQHSGAEFKNLNGLECKKKILCNSDNIINLIWRILLKRNYFT